jgi:hypothetical protein
MLSVTENLDVFCQERYTVQWLQDYYLTEYKYKNKWPQKVATGNSFAPSLFGATSHMPTIQYMKV